MSVFWILMFLRILASSHRTDNRLHCPDNCKTIAFRFAIVLSRTSMRCGYHGAAVVMSNVRREALDETNVGLPVAAALCALVAPEVGRRGRHRSGCDGWLYRRSSAQRAATAAIVALGIVSMAGGVMAQSDSTAAGKLGGGPQKYDWTNHPDIARTGVGPDEIIHFSVNGIFLDVPAAYLEFWPSRKTAEQLNVADSGPKQTGGINIIAWVPGGAPYPFKWWPPRLEFNATPDGSTGAARFNVVVHNLRFENAANYISPSKQFKNVRGSLGGYGHEHFETRYGLEFFSFTKVPAFVFEGYRESDGSDPKLMLRCIKGTLNCDGDVHYGDINLTFYMRIPRQALPTWKLAVEVVRELALRWRKENGK